MALLSHAGSVQSAMSYANIDARLPVLTVKELSTPVEHRLMLMQKSIDLLLKDNVELGCDADWNGSCYTPSVRLDGLSITSS